MQFSTIIAVAALAVFAVSAANAAGAARSNSNGPSAAVDRSRSDPFSRGRAEIQNAKLDARLDARLDAKSNSAIQFSNDATWTPKTDWIVEKTVDKAVPAEPVRTRVLISPKMFRKPDDKCPEGETPGPNGECKAKFED